MTVLKTLPAVCLALVGCGGGDASVGRQGPSGTEFPVVTGDSAPAVAVPAGSQEIIGSHAISLFAIREIQLQKTKGAERLSDGAVTIADGTSIFMGSSGYDTAGVQNDNLSQVAQIGTSGTYSAATMYTGGIADQSNNIFYAITQGVYGQAAPAAAIASSGSATYTGDASAIYEGTEVVQLNSGTSTLTVNFSGKRADVTMSGFSGDPVPFDTISVSGMAISGNRFDGGTLNLSSGGASVAGLGADTKSAATGAFFGSVNGAGIPAEAGGQVYARGASGALISTFIAK